MTQAKILDAIENAPLFQNEPPRALRKQSTPPEPFPVIALGDTLEKAALAIHDKVQAPLAICAQSVLAAATLAVQAYADVMLPIGQKRPISNYWISIAGTGERKTSADNEAIISFEHREEELRISYDFDLIDWKNKTDAFEKQRVDILKDKKFKSLEAKTEALSVLGQSPIAPLTPMLICPEPTFEGLCRLYMNGMPSMGLFSSEGGQFIGGHGMSEDNKLKTSTAISGLWDGKPIKRVRAGDGAVTLAGKRLSMHLMVQPGVAARLLSDKTLLDQGLISRFLITAPESTAGTRFHKIISKQTEHHILNYQHHLLKLLQKPLPLRDGKINELNPRTLTFTDEAATAFYGFCDHIEALLKPGGLMEPIVGLANKLPEHAVRLACVIALIDDINVPYITIDHLTSGIQLAQYYAREALRLVGEAIVPPDILLAERLLNWLHNSWALDVVSLPDIYQRSLNAIHDKATAQRIVSILVDHG